MVECWVAPGHRPLDDRGEPEPAARLDAIFAELSWYVDAPRTTLGADAATITTAEHGYLHCGPVGAGHFVKMVHNGIEYGLMAAFAEGFNILHHANAGLADRVADAETAPLRDADYYRYDLDIPSIAESAPRQCRLLVAARPHCCRGRPRTRKSTRFRYGFPLG